MYTFKGEAIPYMKTTDVLISYATIFTAGILILSVTLIPHQAIHNTVRSRYIAVIFLRITHERAEGRGMGCHSRVQIWPKFYHCNCCAVCTIVLYVTAIYRESIVCGSKSAKNVTCIYHINTIFPFWTIINGTNCRFLFFILMIYYGSLWICYSGNRRGLVCPWPVLYFLDSEIWAWNQAFKEK